MLDENYLNNLPFKARGIAKMTGYLGDFLQFIDEFPNRPLRVLEIGFGFGQLVAELSYLYKDRVDLFGFNSLEDPISVEKIIEVARHLNTIPNTDSLSSDFLNIQYGDAGKSLPYPDLFFDLVLSQVCIPYVQDKLHLVEEICRILSPSGMAYLHVGFEHERLCDGTIDRWETLTLHDDKGKIHLNRFFNNFEGFDYYNAEKGSVLKIKGGSHPFFNISSFTVTDRSEMPSGTYGSCSHYLLKE
ncbi:class I SAM-dependent methyltransferase [Mucilaginibacter defluvii]|uniref:Methyltransferase type 11 domain-containing protein n=1 Tax=Mucilaginibacter defluvii TaxID=1196019 RepID=A0ABP9G393_9SPHI